MKILFAGGGTFGHVAPALSVADALRRQYPNAQILFAARAGGAENESIRASGYPIREIPIESIGRKGLQGNAHALLLLTRSFAAARKILEDAKPDLVFGTGGYVCFPTVRTAQRMGIGTLLHESNATPGRACKMLAKRCDAVLLGMRDAQALFPSGTRCIYTGNPVRADFFKYTKEQARRILGVARSDKMLLSFGGSGGARALNEAAMRLMQDLSESGGNFWHVHAAGRKYFEKIKGEHPSLTSGKGHFRVYPYIDDMALYMRAADLCICRSGAMTVSELAAARLPAILIPSPNVKDDHQYKNAKSLADAGGALILSESDPDKIENAARALLSDEGKRAAMQRALSDYGGRDAAQSIAKHIVSFLPDNK